MSDSENPIPAVSATSGTQDQQQEPPQLSYEDADRVLTASALDEDAALDMLYRLVNMHGPDDPEWIQQHLTALAERAEGDRLLAFIIVCHELLLLWWGSRSISFVQTYTTFATLLRRHPHLDAHVREQTEWIEFYLFRLHLKGVSRPTLEILQELIEHGERVPQPLYSRHVRRRRERIRPVRTRRKGRR